MGCLREINKQRRGRTLRQWVETTRNAELVVVLGEDLAALVGLVLAFVFVSMAAYTGKVITWDDALASKEALGPETYEWGPAPSEPVPVPGVTSLA